MIRSRTFYNSMTNCPSRHIILLCNEPSESEWLFSLSGRTKKGTVNAVPSFFFKRILNYLTETAAGSSTFASRKNFAASSGGVGLI